MKKISTFGEKNVPLALLPTSTILSTLVVLFYYYTQIIIIHHYHFFYGYYIYIELELGVLLILGFLGFANHIYKWECNMLMIDLDTLDILCTIFSSRLRRELVIAIKICVRDILFIYIPFWVWILVHIVYTCSPVHL